MFPEHLIGKPGNSETRTTDYLKDLKIFPGGIKTPKTTACFYRRFGQLADEIANRCCILERRQILHEPVVDLMGNSRPQRDVRYSLAQGESLLGFLLRLPLFMTKYPKFSRIVDGCLHPEHILFVVQFHRIPIDPMAKADTIIETGHACHNFIR